MNDLEFDPIEHKYKLHGRGIPSVTQILSGAGLVDTEWYTLESRERGKAVHTACHYLDEGDLDFDTVAIQYLPYVEAYQKFLSEVKPKWEFIEHQVYDEVYWYSGTFDRAGTMNNQQVIIDLKTGTMPKTAGLQTAAYKAAFDPNGKFKRYGLLLEKTGDYKLVPFNDHRDLKIFRCAAAIVNWRNNNDI